MNFWLPPNNNTWRISNCRPSLKQKKKNKFWEVSSTKKSNPPSYFTVLPGTLFPWKSFTKNVTSLQTRWFWSRQSSARKSAGSPLWGGMMSLQNKLFMKTRKECLLFFHWATRRSSQWRGESFQYCERRVWDRCSGTIWWWGTSQMSTRLVIQTAMERGAFMGARSQ